MTAERKRADTSGCAYGVGVSESAAVKIVCKRSAQFISPQTAAVVSRREARPATNDVRAWRW